jgi:hypothetical protein
LSQDPILAKQVPCDPKLRSFPLDIMFYNTASLLFALSTSAIASNICGTVGIHDDNKISYYMGNFFYKGPSVATVTLCASWCKKDVPKCKAFRWSYYGDSASQYCEFFDNGLYVLFPLCS